jgi:hypothetical protein
MEAGAAEGLADGAAGVPAGAGVAGSAFALPKIADMIVPKMLILASS